MVDPEDPKPHKRIKVSAGDWVLGAVERYDRSDVAVTDSDAAYVGEVLQANFFYTFSRT